MKTNVEHVKPMRVYQCARIMAFFEWIGGDHSIGEVAHALGMEKSTVSARVNFMLNTTHELVVKPKRKDRRSGINVRPVGLPVTQRDLFQ